MQKKARTDEEIHQIFEETMRALSSGSKAIHARYKDDQVTFVTNAAQAVTVMLNNLEDGGAAANFVKDLFENHQVDLIDVVAVGIVVGVGLAIQEEIR